MSPLRRAVQHLLNVQVGLAGIHPPLGNVDECFAAAVFRQAQHCPGVALGEVVVQHELPLVGIQLLPQADRVLVMSKGHVVMEGTPKEVFSQTEKVRSLHLDVPQAAELRDELVKAGIPMPEGIIDTGECAQALYELLQ